MAKKKVTDQDRFFSALDESFGAMTDALKTGNERGFRVSRRLVREIEQGQQEITRLARRFARKPSDMGRLYRDGVDLARRGVGHASQLSQEFVSGARDAGQDLRGTTTALIKANRSAAQALGHALQGAAKELVQRARGKVAPRRRPPAAKGRATAKGRTPAKRRRAAKAGGRSPTRAT